MSRYDERAGLAYTREVVRHLWPDHAASFTRRRTGTSRSWWLLPRASGPRLVVPTNPVAARTAVTLAAAGRGGRAERLMRSGAHALGRPVAGRMPATRLHVTSPLAHEGTADWCVDDALEHVLDERVHVAWSVGPRRANRKPVLHVIGEQGRTLAFAKAAFTPLNRRLVAREARALRLLADAELGPVTVPTPVASFEVAGSVSTAQVLVLSPVPTSGDALPPAESAELPEPIVDAMLAISRASGSDVVPLRGSPWWQGLGETLAGIDTDADAASLRATWQWLGEENHPVAVGAWHGDWNPGNYAILGDRVTVWDWERFDTGVPAGFDAQHLAFQGVVTSNQMQPLDAARWVVATAPTRLEPWQRSARAATLTAISHLLELGVRYLRDDQRAAGAPLGRVEQWLDPVLQETMTALTHRGDADGR